MILLLQYFQFFFHIVFIARQHTNAANQRCHKVSFSWHFVGLTPVVFRQPTTPHYWSTKDVRIISVRKKTKCSSLATCGNAFTQAYIAYSLRVFISEAKDESALYLDVYSLHVATSAGQCITLLRFLSLSYAAITLARWCTIRCGRSWLRIIDRCGRRAAHSV